MAASLRSLPLGQSTKYGRAGFIVVRSAQNVKCGSSGRPVLQLGGHRRLQAHLWSGTALQRGAHQWWAGPCSHRSASIRCLVCASNTPSKVTTSLQTPRATAGAAISGAVGSPAVGFALSISTSRLQHSLLSVHHASNHELGGVGRPDTPAKVPTLVASQHSPQTLVAMRRPSFGRDVAGKTQVSNVAPLACTHAAHETPRELCPVDVYLF